MKTNFNGILTLLLALVVQISFAQDKTISGTVSDESGPLPGVSILIRDSTKGTETDFDGKYTIKAKFGDVLVFRYLGYKTSEKTVGNSNILNVILEESGEALDEVVLNVFGIEKKKDFDMSSSTNIASDDLQRSGETGLIQGLSGKTSGILITKTTGDPGAGAYIQIRGQNTILGSSSPLIILDGVPISNSSPDNFYLGGSQNVSGIDTDGTVQQSRLNDINPEDIASVTVLKGAAAATIYGSGAANGVIILKTKSGRKGGKPFFVNFKQSVAFDQILTEFEKQEKYGQGSSGKYGWRNALSWGDKISDRSGVANVTKSSSDNPYFLADNGKKYYEITEKNDKTITNEVNRDQVFQTGTTYTTNLGLGVNSEKSSTFFSLSNLKQEGIIRGQSTYDRITLRFNNQTKLLNNLTLKFNSTYSRISSKRVQQGSNTSGLYLGYLRSPVDFDNTDYKGLYYRNETDVAPFSSHRSYRNGIGVPNTARTKANTIYNNPGWTINEQTNPSNVHRFIVNPEVNWNINKSNLLTFRYGLDYTTDSRNTFFPVSSAGEGVGQFYSIDENSTIQTFNAFLTSSILKSDKFNLDVILGTQFDDEYSYIIGGSSKVFSNPNVDNLRIFGNAESKNELPFLDRYERKKSGAYVSISSNYNEELFFTLAGRYDRPSTVKDAVFYPSISAGWIFSKRIEESDLFSFGKIRASYGQVGIEPLAYLNKTNFVGGDVSSSWSDQLLASAYGNPFQQSFRKGNPNLKIELVTETEIGFDLRFFNNSLRLGTSYYNRNTTDAILELALPVSTGFSSFYDNAAEIENKGVEVDLGYNFNFDSDFKLSFDINWSMNKNIVTELKGTNQITLNGFTSVSSSIVKGEPFGVLWGTPFKRDASGNLELDSNGFPVAAGENAVLGDPNPDWLGGFRTTASYKGINLSVAFDTSQGNDIWTGTSGVLKYFGIHKETANESTAPTDLKTANGNTITKGTVFRGNIKDYGGGNVALDQSWYTTNGGGFGSVSEEFVKDGSWTRLREISLGYSFPKKIVKNLGLSNLEVLFTGRNLILWTDIEGVDPESNLSGTSKGRGLDYFTNPSTKSYLATIKISL